MRWKIHAAPFEMESSSIPCEHTCDMKNYILRLISFRIPELDQMNSEERNHLFGNPAYRRQMRPVKVKCWINVILIILLQWGLIKGVHYLSNYYDLVFNYPYLLTMASCLVVGLGFLLLVIAGYHRAKQTRAIMRSVLVDENGWPMFCPTCGYRLWGLSGRQSCPECGGDILQVKPPI